MSSITILADDGSAEITVGVPVPIGAGEANTLVDAGQNVHESLVATPDKVAEALRVKGLRAGAGVTITEDVPDQVLVIGNTAGAAPGDVTGPATATLNAPAVFADGTGKVLKEPDADLDLLGQALANIGLVDGRDISVDGAALDAHVADLANPHATTAAQTGADPAGSAAAVQANLTTHVADLANPHATTAAQTGADPAGTAAAAVSAHESAFDHTLIPSADEKAALAGTGAPGAGNPYVVDSDARMTDARSPTGAAGGDLAGTYPTPTVPHVILTNNPHSVTAGQVGAIPVAEKGAPNGVATLDGGGEVPVGELPERAKSKVTSVADAAARLALSAEQGDVARQLDTGEFYHYDGSAWLLVPGASTVTGPGLSVDNEVAVYDGTSGQVLKRPNVAVSLNSQNIVSVGTVDGRTLSTDGAKLDGIEAGAKDDQTISAGVGLTGGGTGDVSLGVDFGDGAGQAVEGTNTRVLTQAENDAAQGTDGAPSNANRYVTNSDSRNSDARAPTAHAATHQHGGGDEVATTIAAPNAIPKAAGGGTILGGWIDDTSHGSLGGGALHADAIPSVSGIGGSDGFITAQNQEKLDGIEVGAQVNQQINANTGLTGGGSGDTVNLAADIGTGVGQVAAGNDARFPTSDMRDALEGTSGAPDNANRYVTSQDPRVPTQDENDALQGTSGAPSGGNPYVTQVDPRVPTQAENDALQGTDGTPSGSNRFVTDSDPRLDDWVAQQSYYVGKHGNDANTGLSYREALLTIGAAIAKAVAQTPSASNRFAIIIADAGIYAESPALQPFVDLHAPGAKISGNIALADDSKIRLHTVESSSGAALSKLALDTGKSIVDIDFVAAGAATGISVAGGTVEMRAVSVTASTTYNVSSGATLNLFTNELSGTPIVSGAAAVSVVGQYNTFVYRPAGIQGGNEFTSWADLMVAHDRVKGPKTIAFIDDGVTITIPAGSYAISPDTTFVSGDQNNDNQAAIALADGVVFTEGGPNWSGFISVDVQATTVVPIDRTTAGPLVFEISKFANISCSGTLPLYRFGISGAQGLLFMADGGAVSTGNTEVFDVAASGSSLIGFGLSKSTWQQNTVKGVVGAIWVMEFTDTASRFSEVQSGFNGTRLISYLNSYMHQDGNLYTGAGPFNVIPGSTVRCDPSSNAISFTINESAPQAIGKSIEFVVNVGTAGTPAANNVTITAFGANTIDGAASYVMTNQRESVTLRSDGLSNWMVVAQRP